MTAKFMFIWSLIVILSRISATFVHALAQVIRFHPKVPGVWIYAAAWEFDHNLNAAAGRALMQRGLGACPNSEDLWVEYLPMELTYLNKLKAQKVALGEDDETLLRDAKVNAEMQWRNESG
ncbi:OLC1v1027883C1 [Oldenlandia corymbosa var. corymbosa]|uniref:OLC1v1027883C1 n=1 Tax=Oldenlandia corymbosa var. corymbosa TaxID=529605 RepID=A0AAV1CAG6_OLDCO|nr:OLC1v1027883C1 [Oldenlandia corymbosa var. corymbosa]